MMELWIVYRFDGDANRWMPIAAYETKLQADSRVVLEEAAEKKFSYRSNFHVELRAMDRLGPPDGA